MPISSNIADFRSRFKGGSRPNRFVVNGNIPTSGDVGESNFLIKAATLPPSTLGIIPVPFRGRILKVPGDRMFIEWDIVVLDDPKTRDLRKDFLEWSHAINEHADNVINQQDFYGQWKISQLEQSSDTMIPGREITLHNCWPVEVSGVELTHDVPNTLVEWSVRMAYDFWTSDGTS